MEYIEAKILESTLESQVSWSDTYDEIVDHQFNLPYTSK